MSIDELRRRIDGIDDQILELLEERAKAASSIGALKRQGAQLVHDPEREERIFSRLEDLSLERPEAAFPRTAVRSVFREIVSACRSTEALLRVAYLGPPATFTHLAARSFFGEAAEYLESPNIDGILDAVARRNADYGVAPIENSTEGSVSSTLDGLLESPVLIRSELVLRIHHCLAGLTADLGRIARVYSHPQALGQCRAWIHKNLPHAELVPASSTSAAARAVKQDPSGVSAAIASRLAAELEGLAVIRDGIQDRPENATRFVVVSSSDAPRTGHDKTSLVFCTPDERGALRQVLEIFERADVNLTRIESRPARDTAWTYVFFTDLEGHRTDDSVRRCLDELRERDCLVKFLGSYPRARGPVDSLEVGSAESAPLA